MKRRTVAVGLITTCVLVDPLTRARPFYARARVWLLWRRSLASARSSRRRSRRRRQRRQSRRLPTAFTFAKQQLQAEQKIARQRRARAIADFVKFTLVTVAIGQKCERERVRGSAGAAAAAAAAAAKAAATTTIRLCARGNARRASRQLVVERERAVASSLALARDKQKWPSRS